MPESPRRRVATVVMLDIVGSTPLAGDLGDARWREVLTRFRRIVRRALKRFGGREQDTAGDGFFATFTEPAQALRAAAAITADVQELGLDVRTGIHTGECEEIDGKLGGIAVHTGARVMGLSGPAQVYVTGTVKDLVAGSGANFSDRGERDLKGLEGRRRVFALTAIDTALPPPLTPEQSAERLAQVVPPRTSPRLRIALAAAAIAAVAAAIAIPVLAFRGGESSVTVLPGSVVKIDPARNKVVDSVAVGDDPGQPRVLAGAVFVTSVTNKTLNRIDMRTDDVITSGEYAAGPGLAADDHQLWVASESRADVTRVNPRDLSTIERIRLGDRPPGELEQAFVALGGGSLWVSEALPAAVTRWDMRTHRLVRRYELSGPAYPVEITYGKGGAWVPNFSPDADEILHIDGATGATSEIEVGPRPTDPVVGFGSVWVTSTEQGTVWRIDALTERVERVIPIGGVPYGTAVGAGSVWVTDYCRGTVVRIDPRTNEIVARIEVGHIPRWLTFGAGHVWVGVAEKDEFDLLSSPGCQGSRSESTATS